MARSSAGVIADAHDPSPSRTQGEWAPAQIPNPDYYVDETPLKSIGKVGAVALEIWTMSAGMVFDNFLITTDEEVRQCVDLCHYPPRA
jgi:hypothetical protein